MSDIIHPLSVILSPLILIYRLLSATLNGYKKWLHNSKEELVRLETAVQNSEKEALESAVKIIDKKESGKITEGDRHLFLCLYEKYLSAYNKLCGLIRLRFKDDELVKGNHHCNLKNFIADKEVQKNFFVGKNNEYQHIFWLCDYWNRK